MACNGCKEEKAKQKTARQQWDAKAMATISEAIRATRAINKPLSDRLLALVAELNEIGANERKETHL